MACCEPASLGDCNQDDWRRLQDQQRLHRAVCPQVHAKLPDLSWLLCDEADEAGLSRRLSKAGTRDYEKLVTACLTALLSGEKDVNIAFSTWIRFPKDFPKGVLSSGSGDVQVRRIKALKLLAWLRERGYTDVTSEHIRVQRIQFTMFEKEIANGIFGQEP